MKEEKKYIAMFEIFLIVSLSITFSWTLGISYGTSPNLGEVLDFLIIVPSVSAQATKCCVSTNEGASCLNLPSNVCDSSCSGSCIPSACEAVPACELGCGFSKSEGTCSVNTPKAYCDGTDDCEFLEDPFCNEPKCNKGCCTVGLSTHWYTQSECQIQGERQGLIGEFDNSVNDELACFRLSNNLKEGACVFNIGNEKNECTFTTQVNCDLTDGNFYEGKLCSHPDLNTRCGKQAISNCVEGRDEVYWIDSCGNRENIYSSNKQGSWNNGNVLKKSESCGFGNDNSNSGSCGNCDYNLGSFCGEFRPGVDTGNMEGYTCRDLNCIEETGKKRIHGESWCVYDGTIGVGSLFSGSSGDAGNLLSRISGELGLVSTDLVGSRHFRRVCIDGEVEVEPCRDYREEICVQNDKTLDNGKVVDDAICRVNLWEQCIGYNQQGECGPACLAQCVNNPDCRIHPVFVDSDFRFATCVPKYPAGFDLGQSSSIGGFTNAYASSVLEGTLGSAGGIASQAIGSLSTEISGGDVCSLASNTCTSVWVKTCGLTGTNWECIKNCNCHTASFTAQMNNLCVSMGDCGVYANYEGVVTGGIFGGGARITKKGSRGVRPPPPFVLIPIMAVIANSLKPVTPDGGFFNEEEDILSLPIGIVDPFLSGYNRINPDFDAGGFDAGGFNLGSSQLYALGGSFIGTTILTQFGVLGSSTVFGGFAGGIFAFNPIGAVIVVSIVALTVVLGCGKVDTTDIEFQCLPWERPKGGADCEKCDDDPLKPCSKYRCESLGSRCSLLNEGSGVQECIALEGEDTVPIISPWEDILNMTLYKYEDVSNNGFRVRTKAGECLPAFTPLVFGVNTDIYANCRYHTEPFDYSDFSVPASPTLETIVNNKIVFVKNHTIYLGALPSAAAILSSEINPGEDIDSETEEEIISYLLDQTGDINLYIKCANLDGVSNTQNYRVNLCVDDGPDVQEPVIQATSPANNFVTRFSATEQEAIFYVSEPSECRWDVVRPTSSKKDESYNSLANEMECVDYEHGTLLGWPCNATLPIDSRENKFYIQCKDQPWLTGEESNLRNIGNVFEFNIKKSQSELIVDSIKPEGKILAGSEPIVVDLEVKTSGGVDSGKSICEWGFEEDVFIDRFADTNGREHHYLLNQMTAGEYDVFVRCEDVAGNEASGSTKFILELDTVHPEVTRVFGNAGQIIVSTNEIARCFYNETISNCGFTSENSVEFGNANSQMLSTPLVNNIDYYIMCEDIFGNRPDSCSIVVRSYENV